MVAVALARGDTSAPAGAPGPGVCAALQILAAAALYERVPPPGAPLELEAFVKNLNAELSTIRISIEEACRG